jgi:hypothetical protein
MKRTILLAILAIVLTGCSLSSQFTVGGTYADQHYSYSIKGE